MPPPSRWTSRSQTSLEHSFVENGPTRICKPHPHPSSLPPDERLEGSFRLPLSRQPLSFGNLGGGHICRNFGSSLRRGIVNIRSLRRGEIEPEVSEDIVLRYACLLYTSDAADERSSVDLGGRVGLLAPPARGQVRGAQSLRGLSLIHISEPTRPY